MSLDVYLIEDSSTYGVAADLLGDHGFTAAEAHLRAAVDEPRRFYNANITHNLVRMAEEAGIYKALWRPEEIGIEKAEQLIKPLEKGLALLRSDPDHFRKFNASNGWGIYEDFIPFVEKYLAACKTYPHAAVKVSR